MSFLLLTFSRPYCLNVLASLLLYRHTLAILSFFPAIPSTLSLQSLFLLYFPSILEGSIPTLIYCTTVLLIRLIFFDRNYYQTIPIHLSEVRWTVLIFAMLFRVPYSQ